ncbi:MAG TPA: hypothetical protein VLD64_01210 [Nitrosarchaeum sp.]|nr:hypothetical protein [Nitrosarchaeum sp.]
MSRTVFLAVLIVGMFVIGSSSTVWAAQVDARINPNSDTSPFSYHYQKTIFIEYPDGGKLFDILHDKEWTVTGSADSSNPGVQQLIASLNTKMQNDKSHSKISDLKVSYEIYLKGRNLNTSIDYKIILEGNLANYVITKDQVRTLIDLGWRGVGTNDPVTIDGQEINFPISILKEKEPEVYSILSGTDAESILSKPLINADYILEQPMSNWHFLFDPTGINVDAGTFGLDKSISGFVVSKWTMGESSLREGRQVEKTFSADVTADKNYAVRSVQSADQGNIAAIGFGALDIIDGLEIAGITPKPPSGYATTSTGGFPVTIVYGMAGMAAIGGIAFFIYSNRSLKNEKVGQQGIDPGRLVSYQTSASSGGYQTNRGEAYLVDANDYEQTRSVYDEHKQSPPPASSSQEEAACGCAASEEIGSECDCVMHGSCLCDATCKCNADLCKETASSMR